MNVGSVCTRQIVTIASAASLQDAATLMREHHVGALVVVDAAPEGHCVGGIVTDRDLAIEVLTHAGDASRVSVGRVASKRLVSAPEQAELGEAVEMMQASGVRRLLVHDAEGHLVGLLSFDDLLPACIAPLVGLAGVLRKGLAREAAERGAIAAPARPALRVPAMGTAGWNVSAP